MQLPSANASSDVNLDYVDHFEGAADGWGDAEIITPEQRTAITDAAAIVTQAGVGLRNAVSANNLAERTATKLRARYLIRDIILDMRIMTMSDVLLNGPALRNRQHPIFKSVFQDGTAGDITEAKMREEPELAARARDRFASVPDFEGKTRTLNDLNDAVTKSLDTRSNLDAAETAENKAGDLELQARLAVRIALEQAYGILRAAFPGQRKLVESFFLKRDRSPKKGSEEGGEGKNEK